MQRRIIPGAIDRRQAPWCLPPGVSVRDAAPPRRERHVLAEGCNPRATPPGEIMTANPETLRSDDTALAALEKMRAGRHHPRPPVLDAEGRVRGMVSIRDLLGAVRRSLDEEPHPAEAPIRRAAAPPPPP